MIFPDSLEAKLGFDQIRNRLRSYCLSGAGIAGVDSMHFSADLIGVQTLLRQNLEFSQILEKEENFPSQNFFDGHDWLARIALEGSFLEAEEFLALAKALETIIACRNFLVKARDVYPQLHALAQAVNLNEQLPRSIQLIIDDRGKVRDSASPELGRIRKKLRDEEQRLRKLADSLFRTAVEHKWVPEGALPTIREGRLVIPIQAEHKRRLRGFILDESASGQTVFMEPTELLETNNAIRDLEHAEKREVIAVLKALTAQLKDQLPGLRSAFHFLGLIDFIRAKAKFSIEIRAALPQLDDQPGLDWLDARHPLLYLSLKGKREVVPLTISLEAHSRLLLVSGPNAGGKSVCLKTVGLLQYMMQCGMLIPVSEKSRVGIFHDIFIDIGDQQSIENDLSTYSSHLHNMSVFIRAATDRSMVLMDELGSGTDPDFGGAIAQAVLEALLRKGVWGIATTHYYNLKLFAGQRQGIANAAMRFDDKNLVPLYILDIGKPGSSFALEIARKTGLPPQTIEEAEKLVGKDLAGFESLVRSLEKERQQLSERLRTMERQEAELKRSLSKYETLATELETKKKEIIGKAKEQAAELLKETNREIEKTIRHIRENKAERKETLKVRRSLESLSRNVAPGEEKKPKAKEPIREGDRVRIAGQEGSGTVIAIKNKTASVQFGDLKSQIDVSRLEKVAAPPMNDLSARRRPVGVDIHGKQAKFNSTLDVRGKRADEVVALLDEFIDTAILLGHSEIRILHGKGEGVLRKVIREHLKKYGQVASATDEHVDRGGDGITVVVLN